MSDKISRYSRKLPPPVLGSGGVYDKFYIAPTITLGESTDIPNAATWKKNAR